MLQKWIKAEEAADMPAGGGGPAIIRPVTRRNGKEATICQLRPKRCHLHQSHPIWSEYSHTDTLTRSARVAARLNLLNVIIETGRHESMDQRSPVPLSVPAVVEIH